MKFYEEERRRFEKESKLLIDTQPHIQLIVKKLLRHFELPDCGVVFIKNQRKGKYFGYPNSRFSDATITLPWNKKIKVPILLICHEVAHHWHVHKYGRRKVTHTKKLMRLIERLVKYCRKKNY